MRHLKLDLGCGWNKKEGFVGVDANSFDGVDIVFDLRQEPWPWDDNSVEDVYSRHFVEHLTGKERIIFFNEMYRVLKPGAIARIITPHWSHESAYGDPTHEWPPVTCWTYYYLNTAWRESYGPHVGYKCNFAYELSLSHDPNDQWVASKDMQTKILLMTRSVNTALDLTAQLTKLTVNDNG